MSAATLTLAGFPSINSWQLPDTTARERTGTLLSGVDPYWGGGEWVYAYATASIRQFGVVNLAATKQTGGYRIEATEAASTAGLGSSLAVAMTSMTVGQFGWFQVYGIVPINSNASVAAGVTMAVAATGQGGALANGKQILNAAAVVAATNTVVIAGSANAGSLILTVPHANGWFIGAYLSGTGIASGAVIVSVDPSGTQVTMSAVTTAAVAGNVTATYNNSTVYYTVAMIDRPFSQGQIL